jgi:hypothetical protein
MHPALQYVSQEHIPEIGNMVLNPMPLSDLFYLAMASKYWYGLALLRLSGGDPYKRIHVIKYNSTALSKLIIP